MDESVHKFIDHLITKSHGKTGLTVNALSAASRSLEKYPPRHKEARRRTPETTFQNPGSGQGFDNKYAKRRSIDAVNKNGRFACCDQRGATEEEEEEEEEDEEEARNKRTRAEKRAYEEEKKRERKKERNETKGNEQGERCTTSVFW